MHFVTYYACCLFAANILHRPLDDKDQDGTDDRHHGEGEVDLVVTTSQVAAVGESNDTQADENLPEVPGVPEEEQAGYNIHTELCCPRCQRPYRSCCSFSLSMILAKANRLAVKPCLTV